MARDGGAFEGPRGRGAVRLGAVGATAWVVADVVGVGIFLTPATMLRATGLSGAMTLWIGMGVLSTAGALCYAELASRFPRAGGEYVFLREAFGRHAAFVYGWISLLVIDPGLTAALGLGFAQYARPWTSLEPRMAPALAVLGIATCALITLGGLRTSTRLLTTISVAKLTAVLGIVAAALTATASSATTTAAAPVSWAAVGPAAVAAFFAFGGWWDVGRMAEEVDQPSRTMPIALVGGLSVVALIYIVATLGFATVAGGGAETDEAMVATLGTVLLGPVGAHVLRTIVLVAVAGSLLARLVSGPRLYLAMARDGAFPTTLAHLDVARGTAPRLTAIQVALASLFAVGGTFDQILGLFIPAAVFFLGLSAAAVLKLPRPGADVFRAPWHPLPIGAFLVLIALVLVLFAVTQPLATAAVTVVGVVGFALAHGVLPLEDAQRRR